MENSPVYLWKYVESMSTQFIDKAVPTTALPQEGAKAILGVSFEYRFQTDSVVHFLGGFLKNKNDKIWGMERKKNLPEYCTHEGHLQSDLRLVVLALPPPVSNNHEARGEVVPDPRFTV